MDSLHWGTGRSCVVAVVTAVGHVIEVVELDLAFGPGRMGVAYRGSAPIGTSGNDAVSCCCLLSC